VPSIVLACLAYLSVALPGSTLGLLWPSMRLGFHQPVGALGILLASGVAASVISSIATGRLMASVRVGTLVPAGTLLVAAALGEEAVAPSLWVFAVGTVLFGLGFGALDSALNAHAAAHFGARDINWVHASYGLGATIGPLATTAVLGIGLSWRWVYGTMAVALGAVACLSALARRSWAACGTPGNPPTTTIFSPLIFTGLIFSAVETGIESGAGIWGYVFLTSGRGLSHEAAGVSVAAYWAMMLVGRAVLGPLAERTGAQPVLGGAVVGVPIGAALMWVPGPGAVAVVGMMALGLAAAPIFPLLTLTTASRLGPANATSRVVALQVAASATGAAAIPAGIGVAIGIIGAKALAPLLFVLALAVGGAYAHISALLRHGRP
jgi:fucose permease